eukprot:9333866-Prorocentrum_lima.AAC.1
MHEPIQTKLPGVEDARAGDGSIEVPHAQVLEIPAQVVPVVIDLDRATRQARDSWSRALLDSAALRWILRGPSGPAEPFRFLRAGVRMIPEVPVALRR